MKFLAVTLAASLGMAAAANIEKEAENSATGHKYARLAGTYTFEEAEKLMATIPSRCGGEPAHMVTIEDLEENSFVTSNMLTADSWIGLHDRNTENVFEWVTGEQSHFENWAPGEPNNVGNEDGTMIQATTGKWNDLPVTEKKPVIIEWNCVKPTTLGADIEFEGHTYAKLARQMSYHDALTIMVQLPDKCGVRPHLATPQSSAENEKVKSIAGGEAWIGLDDMVTEGKFEWVDGKPVEYTNWAPGEPNDYKISRMKGEDATQMQSSGRWNDMPTTGHDLWVIAEWDCPGTTGSYTGTGAVTSTTGVYPVSSSVSGDPHVSLWNGTMFDFHGGKEQKMAMEPTVLSSSFIVGHPPHTT